MSITLGSNIASLRGQRQLANTSNELATVFERLSSGQRINKASDDPAGLAVAQGLISDQRVFIQGVRNLNDGISLLNIADSSIEALTSIVVRLEELAAQAANGVYGVAQRKVLDAEAQALSDEYFRISRSTEFNGLSLFDGSVQEVRLQAGYGIDGSIASGLGGALGDGTFSELATYATEASISRSVTLGDLNGDGVLDMVTAGDSGPGEATVFLGQGDGTFREIATYATEDLLSLAVTLGDLNGDGVLDMVTAGYIGSGGEATVFLGQGDGTFQELATYATEGLFSYAVTLGDLNGDGVLDMVTAGDSGPGEATVFLGQGDGSFRELATYATELLASYAVTLGDLNGDGVLDMITAGDSGPGEATVFLGQGDGTFQELATYAAEGFFSLAVTLGDLNGDGVLDMVTAGQTGGAGEATVFLGQEDGTFTELATFATEGFQSHDVTLGDLNGDGVLDMVTAGDSGPGEATVFLGQGDGTFSELVTYATESLVSLALTLGDLNGDGVLDMVTAGDRGPGEATVFLSNTINGVAPLLPFTLDSIANARQALPVFQRKLDQLAEQRGTIGAFQARIEVATNVLQVAAENFSAAAARITDADIAEESSKLVRLNILQQASVAVLAQANIQPSIGLQLLGL